MAITELMVQGFKSIADQKRIEIRPLTLLAGANSSGKSSMMQPLLLMKQTLESTYDPGPLLLNGPNVQFTRYTQFLRRETPDTYRSFAVGLSVKTESPVELFLKDGFEILFSYISEKSRAGLDIIQAIYHYQDRPVVLFPNLSSEIIEETLNRDLFAKELIAMSSLGIFNRERFRWRIIHNWFFLNIGIYFPEFSDLIPNRKHYGVNYSGIFEENIRRVIHLAGFRGNPSRSYPYIQHFQNDFPGTFEPYTASLIYHWQSTHDPRLQTLSDYLKRLGLSRQIAAARLDDTQIEIQVNRLPADTLVSVADVGFGVSQVLPVLVSLLAAERDQLVYIEQPELHLHPRAQITLAQILVETAQRGVRVVIETHSALLILGIQTLVAQAKADPTLIKLHWFTLDDDGNTQIASHDLDENGAYGDWPEDFGDVELAAQHQYLSAVEERILGESRP